MIETPDQEPVAVKELRQIPNPNSAITLRDRATCKLKSIALQIQE